MWVIIELSILLYMGIILLKYWVELLIEVSDWAI